MSLFRKQVFNKQYDNLWGQVTLSQPLSYKVLIAVFFIIVSTCIGFLLNTEYHRKERVSGIILPEEGVVQLFSPGYLSVAERYISQGDVVVKDQPLLRLSPPILFGTGENEVKVKIGQLKEQITLLEQQLNTIKGLAHESSVHLTQKLVEQKKQLPLLMLERDSVTSQLLLTQTRLNKHNSLLKAGLISTNQISQLQEQDYRLQREIHSINRIIKQLEQQQQQTSFEIAKLPTKTKQQLDQVVLSISDKKQLLTKLQASTDILITAPTDGTIATMDVHQNQWLQPQQFIMSVLPSELTLHAELYVPTRAYGFIKEGQTTNIKLDAFPFEKFGSINGVVIKKSTHTRNPATPNSISDNYKVRVQLNKQTISAYGEEVSLLSGMRLAADILIDKRTLLEWLLAPLYSLKG